MCRRIYQNIQIFSLLGKFCQLDAFLSFDVTLPPLKETVDKICQLVIRFSPQKLTCFCALQLSIEFFNSLCDFLFHILLIDLRNFETINQGDHTNIDVDVTCFFLGS